MSDRSKGATNFDNTINVLGSVVVAPKLSVRNRCMDAGVSKSSFHRMLQKNVIQA